MSMTDLKAFAEMPVIGARKFPAAPALNFPQFMNKVTFPVRNSYMT
jgi:hypothetical protein